MNKKMTVLIAALVCGLCAFAGITISPSSIDYAVGGGGAAIKTSGSGTWTATSDADWITVVKSSGEAGTACTYIVSRNNSADSREGHIFISGNTYTVTQKGCAVALSPASASFGKIGGNGVIAASVDAGVTWTASPSDTWITVTPVSGSGAAELSYTVAANDAVGSRTGTICIGSEKFVITQAGVDVTLSPAVTNVTKDVCIVPLHVVALTETTWKVTPQVSWISVLDGGTGRGGSQVSLAVAENPSFEKRTGTVTIGSATFTVVQSGTDDVNFKILPEVATASPLGAFANVAVYATPDATWSAESQDSWIKIASSAEGAGNGNVKYITMSNPELTERTGHIKFTPPVAVPDLDLYAGLLFWIKEQANIEGNELRQTTYPLSKVFDGSFSNILTGKGIPAKKTDDYTLSFSFKVGELDCLNRLVKIGGQTLYLDTDNVLCFQGMKTSLAIEDVNTYYTVVIHVNANHALSIYGGFRDTELECVLTGASGADLSFATDVPLSSFIFGYGNYPSTGYLQSGRFDNIRFWARALTNRECQTIDTKSDVSFDVAPSFCTDEYTYFPFSGNLFAYNATNAWAMTPGTEFNGRITNAYAGNGRCKIPVHALRMTADSRVELDDLNEFFRPEYTLHSGDLSWDNYDLTYNDPPCGIYKMSRAADSSENEDATISMWLKIDELPQEGGCLDLLARQLSPRPTRGTTSTSFPGYIPCPMFLRLEGNDGGITNNYRFGVYVTSEGKVGVSQMGCYYRWKRYDTSKGYYNEYEYYGASELTTSNICANANVACGEWINLTIVGRAERSVGVYLNGVEIGNFPTKMWFGYLPPNDFKFVTNDGSGTRHGDLAWHSYKFSVGNFSGGLDDLTIYNRALSAKEVREVYESRLPAGDVYHTVHQGIQQPTITPDVIKASRLGVTTNVVLSVAKAVNWDAVPNDSWISIVGASSGTGPSDILVKVNANTTCYERMGTVSVGPKTLMVEQEALNCEIEADRTVFPTEAGETGGMGIISVSPEGNGSWTAESDVDWIYCYPESGTGSYDVYFFVEDMGSTAASRSGKITIGGKTIEITQRGYDLSIDPQICEVGGNAGAGVIGVAADVGAVWTAIADVPWITIVQTTDKFVHYTYTDNTTGETRIGHINISGEEYELRQTCKLDLNTTVVGKGTVTGGGKYAQGVTVSLKATPANGYEFSHWSGDVVGVESDTSVIMDTVKNVTATFIPEAAAQVLAEKKAAQGGFYTRDQIHNLELGNLVLDVDSATGKARIGVQLQETSDLSNPNWQPVEVTSGDVDLGNDGTVGIKAKATGNGMFYRVVVPKK